jgi:CHAD domain-containing protein
MTERENVVPLQRSERGPLYALAPERAARKLLLRQLKDAENAGQRLAGGEDPDALHDFRVALRRFRSIERAYRSWVEEALPKKLRKRLRELVHSTGPVRDCEVQLHWLEQQRIALRPNQRVGYHWLQRRLEDRQRQGYAAIRGRLPLEFAGLASLLRAALAMPCEASFSSFAQITGEKLQPLLAELEQDFTAIGNGAEATRVHAARLLVKRARYLLEPVAPALEEGKALVAELSALQDLLGGIHDSEVLGVVLDEAAAEAGAARYRGLVRQALDEAASAFGPSTQRRGDERAGLTLLAQRVRDQHQVAHSGLLRKVRNGEVQGLLRRLNDAARILALPPGAIAAA